jgi:hypothetical protein
MVIMHTLQALCQPEWHWSLLRPWEKQEADAIE